MTKAKHVFVSTKISVVSPPSKIKLHVSHLSRMRTIFGNDSDP